MGGDTEMAMDSMTGIVGEKLMDSSADRPMIATGLIKDSTVRITNLIFDPV